MQKEFPFPNVTMLRFPLTEAAMAEPFAFGDENGEYLRLLSVAYEKKQTYRTVVDGEPIFTKRQTANGEVSVIANATQVPDCTVRRVTLRFGCGADELLTGLGQHEDGVYDYRHRSEYLYQNNMIISLPFLLSSAGYGVLIDAECAMCYTGTEEGFTFVLEAVEDFAVTVIRAHSPVGAVQQLMELTGKTRLLPRWAYGYVQSKERYHSSQELIDTAKRFRDEDLGLDCLVQDWHSWNAGLWGDKTPDATRFPSVIKLMEDLHELDTHLLVSIWPNMAKGGGDHAEFQASGKLLPNSDTYNAFDPEARSLYAAQCERYWGAGGVDGYWCDNAEPFSDADWNGENRRPDALRYQLVTESAARSMEETRLNSYALYHAQGMFEHWRANHPEKRMFNLTRSGYTGVQQYGTVLWSGDISARWDVLIHQITEGLKIAMSGISHWTLDTGGFFVVKDAYDRRGCDCAGTTNKLWFWNGDYNDGVADPAFRELYVRWLQYSCFLPVFRAHGTDTPREPWQFGKPGEPDYDTIHDTIALRYRLFPYVYATAVQAWFEGTPMLRSMLLAFPTDAQALARSDCFMLGDSLFVVPVTRPLSAGGDQTGVYLPEGADWYDWFTGAYYPGGQSYTIDTPLSVFPLFARAGSMVPLSAEATCAREAATLADELAVFTGADGDGWLYGDTGDGYAYENGAYTRVPLHWDEAQRLLTLGKAQGTAGLTTTLNITFHFPIGDTTRRSVTYSGSEILVRA